METKIHMYNALEDALRDAETYFDLVKAAFDFQVFREENGFIPKTIKA